MKQFIQMLFFILFCSTVFAQSSSSKGDNLRDEGKLEAAIEAYKSQYLKLSNDWQNTYNLACAYALTFQVDSAYYYLEISLKNDNSLWVLADADFYGLTEDNRWSIIEENQLDKFQKSKGVLDKPEYAKELLNLILKDQALDYYIDQAKGYYIKQGHIPQWYYPLGEFKKQIVKENYKKMQQLIEEYGWPKYSTVGKLAADAPLLIINHHEDDKIREKYLSQIKQSCLDEEGSCMEFAKIQDRILVNDNKLQIYGMQFRYNMDRALEPFPIKDPEYVDERRAKIGLEPLKQYLKRKINYDWTVTQKKHN